MPGAHFTALFVTITFDASNYSARMPLMTATHPFQLAGLGTAPFRVLGVRESVYQSCPGAPVQAGSSCDFCATPIRWVFGVQGSGPSDRPFKVGCDCVRRADPALALACRAARRDYLRAGELTERQARAQAAAKAKAERIREARRQGARDLKAALAANQALRAHVIRATHRTDAQRKIAVEFIRQWVAGFPLSERQVKYLVDLGRPTTKAPSGRVAVVGRVASVKRNDFGTLKARVVSDEGYSVWCTLPSGVFEGAEGLGSGRARVSFVATLTPSADDPTFAFASRPAKGAYLGQAADDVFAEAG